MAAFTLMHRDDFERNGKWMLARRSLDLNSFGMNLVEIPTGDTIPEHDETGRDQEEVFCVLSGDAVLVIDGEDHAAPAGTFARFAPEVRRTARNDGDEPVLLLIASAPRGSGYQPMDWA
jgi:quercetin dioxygenase-like cupin family protein